MGPELAASPASVGARSLKPADAAASFSNAQAIASARSSTARSRSQALRGRYPFASEILTLFEALLDVWSDPEIRTGDAFEDRTTTQASLATHAAKRVMPLVIDATVAHGPPALAAAVSVRFVKANLVDIAARWLASDELLPVDRYLARASLQPLLEAMADVERSALFDHKGGDDLHCPCCNGLPQLSYFEPSGEALVSGPRRLLCARCSRAWIAQRLTCASCGEQASAQLPVFGEKDTFPHIRVDACQSCRRYMLTIDLKKDPRAVPLVDELAALPLDLYAQERGFTKIVPNLMGN